MREIVLVAQDSTRYGLDHGIRDGLAYLLRRLGRIDGIRWIRVMYAYPATLSDGILDAIACEEKVVKYVDIPLQHASDAVLQADEAARPAGQPAGDDRAHPRARARGGHPHLVHRGLPGRDRGRVRGAARPSWRRPQFDNVGVFTFSDEEGTTSFDLRRPRAPGGEGAPQAAAHGRPEEDLRPPQPRAGWASGSRCWSRGPIRTRDLLLRGRLAAQAPEIDGMVVINDGTAEPGRLRDLRDHRSPPLRPGGPDRRSPLPAPVAPPLPRAVAVLS